MAAWRDEAAPMLSIVARLQRTRAYNAYVGSVLSPDQVDQVPEDEVEIALYLHEDSMKPQRKRK